MNLNRRIDITKDKLTFMNRQIEKQLKFNIKINEKQNELYQMNRYNERQTYIYEQINRKTA